MKVTTEKLPKSLLALDIELDRDQVEKGLDRAARQLSQKYTIPGFRKGKAPRFIVENYFGRDALLEQATEDLVNKSFRAALDQEGINPIGQASIDHIDPTDPFHFRVLVPVAPTVKLPDYRAIRVPLEQQDISDETVQQAMDSLREKHVVLRELEEPRPSRQGDQLTVKLESFLDGEPLEEREEGQDVPSTKIILEPGRVVEELYQALIGVEVGNIVETVAHMAEDHANEKVRDKDITFKVLIEGIQERLLPDWEELSVLENFEGTLEELRSKTQADLEASAQSLAERNVIDNLVEQVVAATEYDLPDVLIHDRAHEMLHEQSEQFERYGITLEQLLKYRNKTEEEAVEELHEDAEQQLKNSLALQAMMAAEQLKVADTEVSEEVVRMSQQYDEQERERAIEVLGSQLRSRVAATVIERKLRDRILEIAAGTAPDLELLVADEDSVSPVEDDTDAAPVEDDADITPVVEDAPENPAQPSAVSEQTI